MGEIEMRRYHFRGGPVDGRFIDVPVSGNREWSIPTLDGVWVLDKFDQLPDDYPEGYDVRMEPYLLVGDEYVHRTLVTPEDDPPEHWPP